MAKLKTPQQHIKYGKEQLIRAYKDCMSRQFADVIKTQGGLPMGQWRDTCRTFAMGWAEGLAAQGDIVGAHYWSYNFGEILAPGWYPSEEWRFW